ncbi:hypothetical protein WJX84_008529 [Apatococcus fuscideae]|uniref:Enkurin domain-containing protein n=1 Tax=Apatococcus fuscideae TaxID=2026836 RepID=A0AAW1T705_9CHLO
MALPDDPQLDREYDPDSLIGLLGRGSTAGSKLYRLYYGKPPGCSVGNEFNKRNMERLKSLRQTQPEEKAQTAAKMPAKHQVQIRIPKVGRAQSRALPPQCSQKGRRAASCIIASLQRDAEELQSMRLPAPSGPLLDDNEKARLASLMQYRGEPPDASSSIALQYDGTRSPAQLRELRMLENLFSEVLKEIHQVKMDIAAKISCSDGSLRAQSNIRKAQSDLKFKVQELGRIDALIQQTEAGGPEWTRPRT